MYNKQGWYDTDNTALQCARMGKDKKAKRKNKTKMDRMGRKLGFKKSHKRKVQNKKFGFGIFFARVGLGFQFFFETVFLATKCFNSCDRLLLIRELLAACTR